MANRPRVLITEPIADVGIDLLKPTCELITPWREKRAVSDQDLEAAEALIVRLFNVSGEVISKAKNLKVVGRHGSGLDNVDIPAATARGVQVVYTPRVNANAVAEHAVNLMLAVARHTAKADPMARQNRFDLRGQLIGIELRNRVLGVVGMGAVGSRVAEICVRGFEMKVVAFDPAVVERPMQSEVTYVESLADLLRQADIVTLHLPLTSETRHLINSQTLDQMKPSAVLINTARGGIVDTLALAAALEAKRIRGAGLDVFEDEPLPADHPILWVPRTVLAPHIASSTVDSMDEMARLVARQVLQVFAGERPEFLVNPEAIEGRAKH
jgi:D-3-phosphoglycerate dehydrogenase